MRLLCAAFVLIVAASLQPVVAAKLAFAHLYFDFLLVCVICCALQLSEMPVLAVAVAAGVLKDSFSSCVFSHSVVVFICIGVVVCKLRFSLWVNHWTTQAGLAFSGTCAAWVLYNLLLQIWGLPLEPRIGFVLKNAILNACIAPPLFKVWKLILE